ncbi:hypothetical protein [Streptomyces formicae]
MTPEMQTEYIVQAIREGASMYEEDARTFLAEHDAYVYAAALREAREIVREYIPADSEQRAVAWLLGVVADRLDRTAVAAEAGESS